MTFPSSDGSFRSSVEACLAEGGDTPARLERRLRRLYPKACVSGGIEDRDVLRWYAYREGSWIASSHD